MMADEFEYGTPSYSPGITGILDSIPDEGPPAGARDITDPDFGKGLGTQEMLDLLEPLARQIAGPTADQEQVELMQQRLMDPSYLRDALQSMGMDPTTPFPNNIREPMTLKPGEVLMNSDGTVQSGQRQYINAIEKLGPGEKLVDAQGNVLAQERPVTLGQQLQGIPSTVFENMSPTQQNKILGMGDTFTNIDLPEGRPTMSERLLSQMSLKD